MARRYWEPQAGTGSGEAIGEIKGGDPHLISALRKRVGVGIGTILMSTHSGQKSFKVLSKRLIETSKGRKTKAQPSPGPPSAALTPAWGLGP